MSTYFEKESFPYEFIHVDSNDVVIEIEFNKEPKEYDPQKGVLGDVNYMKQAVYPWYSTFVCTELRNDPERQKKVEKIIKIEMGKLTKISFVSKSVVSQAILWLLKRLNTGFNYSSNTSNKVNAVRILGDLTKVDMGNEPLAGNVKNYDFTVSYTRTNSDKAELVVTVDNSVDLGSSNSPLNSIYNWYSGYVNYLRMPSEIEKECEVRINENTLTVTIPGGGINKKNLSFLPLRLIAPQYKIRNLEIYSNERPTLEHMRKQIDDFEKIKE